MARQRHTQQDLAAALGISAAQVGKRLSGAIALDTAELEKIAEFLGVPVSQFISPVTTRGAA